MWEEEEKEGMAISSRRDFVPLTGLSPPPSSKRGDKSFVWLLQMYVGEHHIVRARRVCG